MIGNLNKKDIIALIYITLLSLVAVVYGFSIIPSPASQQIIATDHKRVVDLGNIQTAVNNYYQTNNILPPTLGAITTRAYDPSTPLEKTDPQTKEQYEYTVTNKYSYQLCATFTTDSTKEQPNSYDTTDYDYPTYKDQFKHNIGHFCFTEKEQPPYKPTTHPTIFPCTPGKMCPMMPVDQPSPAIYNNPDTSPMPSGGAKGGSSG